MYYLTDQHIKEISLEMGIEPALVYAVKRVETGSRGSVYTDEGPFKGQLKVLFEGHYFSKFTGGKYDKSRPELSYPRWTKKYYRVGQEEFGRFWEALEINEEAAALSASWGLFQIMGANFKKLGYSSVEEMIIDFYKSEKNQLRAFFNFCKNTRSRAFKISILDCLKQYQKTLNRKYLESFVYHYNGSGQVERYTGMIMEAYKIGKKQFG